ncbi:MAG: hypothetical protein ABII23_01275 [bacterium]
MSVELGGYKYLFHGNHLIYGYIGYVFYSIIKFLNMPLRAIHSLQIMNCLMGALSAVLFFKLAHAILKDVFLALVYTGCLIFSYVFWLWHIEVQVYPLGFLFLLAAAYILFINQHRNKYILIGLLHALACLGHIVHIIWIPVVLYVIRDTKSKNNAFTYKTDMVKYGMSLIIPLFILYSAVTFFIIKPASLKAFIYFITGSAALTGEFKWIGDLPTIQRLGTWIVAAGRSLIGENLLNSFCAPATQIPYPRGGNILQILTSSCLLILAGYGFYHIKLVYRKNKTILVACVIWICIYAVFFSSWQPGMITYHQSDLIPIWLFFILIIDIIPAQGIRRAISLLIGIGMFLNTFITTIRPLTKRENNPLLLKMDFIKNNSHENDIIIIEGAWDIVYVPYFAQRKYVNINKYKSRIHAIINDYYRKGSNIYVYNQLIEKDRLRELGFYYKIQKQFIMNERFSLFNIIPIEKPHG